MDSNYKLQITDYKWEMGVGMGLCSGIRSGQHECVRTYVTPLLYVMLCNN